MNSKERDRIISTALSIKHGDPVSKQPVNIIIGKSIGDLFEAGCIYRTILKTPTIIRVN